MRSREPTRNRYVLAGDADVAATDAAIANQPGRHEPDGVAGDSEAEPLRGQDSRRVHADHLAPRRHQRPSGVARVERRIGLNNVVHQPARTRAQRAAERADNAGSDGVLKSVRIADRDRDLPDANRS